MNCGFGIAVDGAGNIYTTGSYQNTATFGTIALSTSDSGNVFLAKQDSTGTFLWAKGTDSTGNSNAGSTSLALDGTGHIDITGFFAGTVDFDPGPGVQNLTAAGVRDVFVEQYDISGNLIWVKAIGGTDFDQGYGVAVDSSSNVYTTGTFTGTVDFDPGLGTFNLTSGTDQSIFVSKLSSTGQFVWAKGMTITSGAAVGTGIAIDQTGQVLTHWLVPEHRRLRSRPGHGEPDERGFHRCVRFATRQQRQLRGSPARRGNRLRRLERHRGQCLGHDCHRRQLHRSGHVRRHDAQQHGREERVRFRARLPRFPAPPSAPSAPQLEAGSDSGVSNSDGLTNIKNPVFDVLVAGAGNTVQLLRNGVVVGSRIGPGAITDPGPVPDGLYTYTATQQDTNGQTSPTSPSTSVTISTTPPATLAAPALAGVQRQRCAGRWHYERPPADPGGFLRRASTGPDH